MHDAQEGTRSEEEKRWVGWSVCWLILGTSLTCPRRRQSTVLIVFETLFSTRPRPSPPSLGVS